MWKVSWWSVKTKKYTEQRTWQICGFSNRHVSVLSEKKHSFNAKKRHIAKIGDFIEDHSPVYAIFSSFAAPRSASRVHLWPRTCKSIVRSGKALFIHFRTRFSSRKGREGRAVEGLEIPHSFQQPLIILLPPYQGGAKPGRRCNYAPWSPCSPVQVSEKDSPRQPFSEYCGHVTEPT